MNLQYSLIVFQSSLSSRWHEGRDLNVDRRERFALLAEKNVSLAFLTHGFLVVDRSSVGFVLTWSICFCLHSDCLNVGLGRWQDIAIVVTMQVFC